MPIRPENRARYPKDWPAISASIRERAGNRCEFCGVPNAELGGRSRAGKWYKASPKGESGLGLEWPKPGEEWWCAGYDLGRLRIIRIVLTVAHLDHTPENCEPGNLKALCQRCHLTYDAKHHAQNARITRHEKLGQGDLLGRAGALP